MPRVAIQRRHWDASGRASKRDRSLDGSGRREQARSSKTTRPPCVPGAPPGSIPTSGLDLLLHVRDLEDPDPGCVLPGLVREPPARGRPGRSSGRRRRARRSRSTAATAATPAPGPASCRPPRGSAPRSRAWKAARAGRRPPPVGAPPPTVGRRSGSVARGDRHSRDVRAARVPVARPEALGANPAPAHRVGRAGAVHVPASSQPHVLLALGHDPVADDTHGSSADGRADRPDHALGNGLSAHRVLLSGRFGRELGCHPARGCDPEVTGR